MFNYNFNYPMTMPGITIYMNCDTRLAINLRMFDIGENDEFIFAIKNYDYINSGYAFLFKARKSDIDENGEVIFRVTPRASKNIKPGAFYNFALLANAYDVKTPTEYKKLTENGKIFIEYGAQDLLVQKDPDTMLTEEIIGAKLAPLTTVVQPDTDIRVGEVVKSRLEEIK